MRRVRRVRRVRKSGREVGEGGEHRILTHIHCAPDLKPYRCRDADAVASPVDSNSPVMESEEETVAVRRERVVSIA